MANNDKKGNETKYKAKTSNKVFANENETLSQKQTRSRSELGKFVASPRVTESPSIHKTKQRKISATRDPQTSKVNAKRKINFKERQSKLNKEGVNNVQSGVSLISSLNKQSIRSGINNNATIANVRKAVSQSDDNSIDPIVGDGVLCEVDDDLDYDDVEQIENDLPSEESESSEDNEDSDQGIELGGTGASLQDEQTLMQNPGLRKLFNQLLDEQIEQVKKNGERAVDQPF